MAKDLPLHKSTNWLETAGPPLSALDRHFLDTFERGSGKDEGQHKEAPCNRPDPRAEWVDRVLTEARQYLLLHAPAQGVQHCRLRLDMETADGKARCKWQRTFP